MVSMSKRFCVSWEQIYIYCVFQLKKLKLLLHKSSWIKMVSTLHELKWSVRSKAILIGEITANTFTKILFRYCQFHISWLSSDYKIYYETYKKDLSNKVLFQTIYQKILLIYQKYINSWKSYITISSKPVSYFEQQINWLVSV